jgi:hypothetical protein
VAPASDVAAVCRVHVREGPGYRSTRLNKTTQKKNDSIGMDCDDVSFYLLWEAAQISIDPSQLEPISTETYSHTLQASAG